MSNANVNNENILREPTVERMFERMFWYLNEHKWFHLFLLEYKFPQVKVKFYSVLASLMNFKTGQENVSCRCYTSLTCAQ